MSKPLKPALLIVIVCLLFGQGACRKKGADPNANAAAGGDNSGQAGRSAAQDLVDQGKQFYRDDQDDRALEAFKEAIRIDPELAEAHFRLGLSYDALGQEQEAEESYKKAVEKYKKHLNAHEDDAEAHYNLGQTYAGLSLYTEAVKEYRQATKLKDDDADMFYDLGAALMKLAQYDEAARAFEKSLEIDPDNYRAEDLLAEAQEGVKRIRAGRKHQEDLLKKQKAEESKKQANENANGHSSSGNSNANSTRRP